MHVPKISIITPTLNSGNNITNAIESVLRQNYSNIEHIIVDGASTDQTLHIVKKFMKKSKTISLISEKDNGVYDAMNKGLQACSGDWIYFLGSDDRLYDEFVFNDLLKDELLFKEHIIYGNVKIEGESIWAKDQSIYDGAFDIEKLFKKNICHQSIFYPRSVIKKVGFFNLKYKITADWDYNIRCFAIYPFIYFNRIIAHFQTGGKSSKSGDDTLFQDFPDNVVNYFGLDANDPALALATSPFYYPITQLKIRYLEGRLDTLLREDASLRNINDQIEKSIQVACNNLKLFYEQQIELLKNESAEAIQNLQKSHDLQQEQIRVDHIQANKEIQNQYQAVIEKLVHNYTSAIKHKDNDQQKTWAYIKDKEIEYQSYIDLLHEKQKEFWGFYQNKEQEYQEYLRFLEGEILYLKDTMRQTNENLNAVINIQDSEIHHLKIHISKTKQDLVAVVEYYETHQKTLIEIIHEKEREINAIHNSFTWKMVKTIVRPLSILIKR